MARTHHKNPVNGAFGRQKKNTVADHIWATRNQSAEQERKAKAAEMKAKYEAQAMEAIQYEAITSIVEGTIGRRVAELIIGYYPQAKPYTMKVDGKDVKVSKTDAAYEKALKDLTSDEVADKDACDYGRRRAGIALRAGWEIAEGRPAPVWRQPKPKPQADSYDNSDAVDDTQEQLTYVDQLDAPDEPTDNVEVLLDAADEPVAAAG